MRAPKPRTPVLYLVAAAAFSGTWLLSLWATTGSHFSRFTIPGWFPLLAWLAAGAALVCATLVAVSYYQRHSHVVQVSSELTKLDEFAVASSAIAFLSVAWVLYYIA